MMFVRILASMTIALVATKATAQDELPPEKRFLPFIVKCPAANGRIFEGHFMNMLGQRTIISIIYEDEDSPATVETAVAESGEKVRPRYRVDPDKAKDNVQLSIRRKTLKMTDPLYLGLCLKRGDGEPFKTQFTLDSNRIDLLAAGLSVDDEGYKPFQ